MENQELLSLASAENYDSNTAQIEVVAIHSRLAVEIGILSDSNISADFKRMIDNSKKGCISKHIKNQISLAYSEQAAANDVIKSSNKELKARLKLELTEKNKTWSKQKLETESQKAKNNHLEFKKTSQGIYSAYCVAARRAYALTGYKFTSEKSSYTLTKVDPSATKKPKKSDSVNSAKNDGGMLSNDKKELTKSDIRHFLINDAKLTDLSEFAELINDLVSGKSIEK